MYVILDNYTGQTIKKFVPGEADDWEWSRINYGTNYSPFDPKAVHLFRRANAAKKAKEEIESVFLAKGVPTERTDFRVVQVKRVVTVTYETV